MYPVIYRDNKNIVVSIASDKLTPENIRIEAKLYDFAGKILWQKDIDTLLAANTSSIYMSVPEKKLLGKAAASQCVFEVCVKAEGQDLAKNLFYFKDCKDLKLGNPGIKKTIVRTGDQKYEIILSAEKLAKNVALYMPSSEGFFSDNYFDMIPGRIYNIRYTGDSKNPEAEMEIKCINEL